MTLLRAELGELPELSTYRAPSRPPEPGYYQDGEFGIRIEDIALVVEAQTKVLQWGRAGGWHSAGGTKAELGGLNATSLHSTRVGRSPF